MHLVESDKAYTQCDSRGGSTRPAYVKAQFLRGPIHKLTTDCVANSVRCSGNQRWQWVTLFDPWPTWPISQLTCDPRDPWLTTTHESWLPTIAVSSQDHKVEVLSKSNIISATKYSVETTELNWRFGLSCAVGPQCLEKTKSKTP